MSDYLVNLARRGAGLGATVRSRSLPPPAGEVVPDAGPPEAEPAGRNESRFAAPTVPPAAATAHAPSPPAPVERSPAPAVAASVAAPLVQRVARPVAQPPPAAPPPVAPRAGGQVSAETSRPVPSPRAGDVPAAVALPAPRKDVRLPASAPVPVAGPLVEARAEPARTPQMPSPAEPAGVTVIEPRLVLEREVRQETRVEVAVDRAAPAAPASPEPMVVSIAPAPAASAAPPAPVAVQAIPERPVHVRIGSIEIDAGDKSAAPAQPQAAPVPDAQPAVGFDDFARLRSYTPWGW